MLAALGALFDHGRRLGARRALYLIPDTARAVLRIDTEALARSEAGQALVAQLVPERELSELEAHCGLQPLTDFRELTIWGGGPDGRSFRSVGLLLRARDADAETLAECYRTLVEARGGTLIRTQTPSGPVLASSDGRSAFARVGAERVVTGSPSTVAELLAVVRGEARPLAKQRDFLKLWSSLGGDGAITGVFLPPQSWRSALERAGRIGAGVSAVSGVEAVGLVTGVPKQREAKLLLRTSDQDTARRDATLIEVWASDPPDTLPKGWAVAIRSAEISVEANVITVTVDLSRLNERP